jgi:uncharacterized membrane protein YqhA
LDAFGDAIQHEFGADGAKHVSVEVIILVDLFPLGTVLYVVAVGLYQLFINSNLRTPSWLKITDLSPSHRQIWRSVRPWCPPRALQRLQRLCLCQRGFR